MITLIPSGGLGNRMRAIASTLSLASELSADLHIYWFSTWGLKSPFQELFLPIRHPLLTMKEASGVDYFTLDRPRQKNLYIPRLYQKMKYDACIYEKEVRIHHNQNFNFEKWADQKDVYISSYLDYYPYSKDMMQQLFVPIPEIQTKIDDKISRIQEAVIGVQIRRTDNKLAIDNSPLELFYKRIDLEVEGDNGLKIFLATDSEEVKGEMKKRYGTRIITASKQADRDSIDGIQEAVIDLFSLARTKKIYGSFHSSFSEIAAEIYQTPLEVVSRS
ncbi:MAG: glycosyl transferase [Phocaeicola sp.]